MGAAKEDATRDVYETGTEPDFHISGISRHEDAGDGIIRVYVTSRKGRMDRTEYSFHCSPETLVRLARECMEIASEYHNIAEFRKALREH